MIHDQYVLSIYSFFNQSLAFYLKLYHHEYLGCQIQSHCLSFLVFLLSFSLPLLLSLSNFSALLSSLLSLSHMFLHSFSISTGFFFFFFSLCLFIYLAIRPPSFLVSPLFCSLLDLVSLHIPSSVCRALALAPIVEKGLSWYTVKFKFDSKQKVGTPQVWYKYLPD